MFSLIASLAACPGCGAAQATGSGLCATCTAAQQDAVHQPGLVALGRYEGVLAGAVRALKFRGASRLAVTLAPELARQVRKRGWRPSAVCPVPLHHTRQRQRGYNQAELVARALAAQLAVPCLRLLVRSRATGQQANLATHRRAANTGRAFALAPTAPRILPMRVLLIDDVLTTGATLGACRKLLLAAGCQAVYYAVLAAARPRPATDAGRAELATT